MSTEEQKEKIVETAVQMFNTRGCKGVTMDDIATSMHISKRTLYEVYEDKEQLLYQAIVKYDGRKHSQLTAFATAGHNVIEIILEAYRMKTNDLRLVNPVFYDDILKYPVVAAYIKEVHERTRGHVSQFLRRGVEEGYFRPELDYDMVALLTDAIGQYVNTNKLHKQYSIQTLFENFYMITLRGICTPKGLAVLDTAGM